MKIYGIDEELTAENWDKYNEIIARKYEENVLWHIDLMKATCKYEKVILMHIGIRGR